MNHMPLCPHLRGGDAFPKWLLAICGMAIILTGCRTPRAIRDPEYAALVTSIPCSPPGPVAVAAAMMPTVPDLAGPHSVDDYVAFALAQNPKVQTKRKLVEAAAMRVPQAASLDDPDLSVMGWPSIPHAPQSATGRMTADVNITQKVPWHGKLRARANAAEVEVDMARADLVAAELEVIEQVKRAYYELYFVERSLEITEESRKLAKDLSSLAETKFRTATVSEQDLLRAQLEVSTIGTELIRQRQELQSAQARLARWLHISTDTPVQTLADFPDEELSLDLQRLYEQAIAIRPELQSALAVIRRERLNTDLARLQYFPDLTIGVNWGEMTTNGAMSPLADGRDNLGLSLMVNLPVYRKRLDAGVREGEANVVSSAREYDSLRDETQEQVKDLFAQATSQEQLLRLFATDILPKAEQTYRISITAYQTGQVDFQQLVDNLQQLLRYQVMEERLKAQLRQTMASLERVVGGVLPLSASMSDGNEPEGNLPPPVDN